MVLSEDRIARLQQKATSRWKVDSLVGDTAEYEASDAQERSPKHVETVRSI
ncbi:hypothetical protein [Mycobacterium sp.]|jgi:hypothetical protein|uniref:hypothetical protein n=1 Tax=Mycobacterium sp. TaxID=1785 RepID=UPI002D61C7F9|nr:hypothetical protein [Mycobacterium sp.]HZA09041.1 hypothetical protein [Mycobacterium sp.]